MKDSDQPQGETTPVQGEQQERSPRLPHEHDESSDSQAAGDAGARRMGKLAHDSVRRGEVDTDKGPPLDAAYDRLGGSEENKKRP